MKELPRERVITAYCALGAMEQLETKSGIWFRDARRATACK